MVAERGRMLDHDPLDLVQADVIARSIVEFRRLGRFMPGNAWV